jgi:hypothetical protein
MEPWTGHDRDLLMRRAQNALRVQRRISSWKFENKNAFDGRNDYRPPEIIPRRIGIENLRNLLDTGAAFALLSASAKPAGIPSPANGESQPPCPIR